MSDKRVLNNEQKSPAEITTEKAATANNKTPKDIAAKLGKLMTPSRDTVFNDFHEGFTAQQAIYDAAKKADKRATQKAWMTARAVLADRHFRKYKFLNDFLDKPPEGGSHHEEPPSAK